MENTPEQILLPLEHELAVERLKRYLEQHPEEAAKLAIAYFEDFTMLAIEYKSLELQLYKSPIQDKTYQIGSVVKIIDHDEDFDEWAVRGHSSSSRLAAAARPRCEVIERKRHIGLDSQAESYYFRLASHSDGSLINESLWVTADEICPFDAQCDRSSFQPNYYH